MLLPAIFLDRDGTLNIDYGYLGDPQNVELFTGVGEALSILKNKFNFLLIVVSNQSGISRGLITEEQVKDVNNKINSLLEKFNAKIDAFYWCPAHPDFSSKEEVVCRKPSPYMINKAAKKFNINMNRSYIVGDKASDMICGINAGIKTILVKTGCGKEDLPKLEKEKIVPNFVAENLLEVVHFIEKDSGS